MSEEEKKPEPKLCQYFAIASMMNPISLAGRDIEKIQSRPAQILDYELCFFGSAGMAAAKPKEGASFHGVIHTLTQQNMQKLDKIQFAYDRKLAKAKLYDDTIIDCTVYLEGDKAKSLNPTNQSNPPSQRYLEIIVQGCKTFGVKQEYIDHLLTIKTTPRPKVQQFKKFQIPEGLPVWQMKDVEKGNGEDGNPMYAAINGKVVQIKIDPSESHREMMRKLWAGKHIEVGHSKVLYDPKYGMKKSIEEFTQQHRDYIQHALQNPFGEKNFKVVAMLKKQ